MSIRFLLLSALFLGMQAPIGARETWEDWSLEEQVCQLILPYVDGEYADESTYEFLLKSRPAGVLLFRWSNGLNSPGQVRDLTKGLQQQARELGLPPLFIVADQEGGLVARLQQGFTEFPGNAALGRTDSERLAFLSAQEMAREMRAVGINFTLAPVVDINSNPDNPVIGIRSYSSDPDCVARLGKAAQEGFASAGVISCLKHFPGHGDTSVDSHKGLPWLNKTRAELEECELIPFRKLVKSSPAVMTAHVRISSLDSGCCASLSKPVISELLRKQLAFNGLVLTDSLTMEAIVRECGVDIGEAAVKAFEAGSDLIIMGGRTLNDSESPLHTGELKYIQRALVEAIQKGRIKYSRLRDSLDRIMVLKKTYNIGVDTDVEHEFESERALECAREIAERSVVVEKGELPFDLQDRKVVIVAPQMLKPIIEKSTLSSLASRELYFASVVPLKEEMQRIKEQLSSNDTVLFISYDAWRFQPQGKFIQQLAENFSLILVASRDSRDIQFAHSAELVISTVSPTAVALSAVKTRFLSRR